MRRGKHGFFSAHGLASQRGETRKPAGRNVEILAPTAVGGRRSPGVDPKGRVRFWMKTLARGSPGRSEVALLQGQR